jgi:hypothetical protein
VRSAQGRVARVAGRARLRLVSPAARGSAEALAAAEKPDRLRVDVLDFFGNPAASLVAAGGRFLLVDLRRGAAWRGAATPEALERLLPVSAPVEDVVAALCGTARLVDGRAEARGAGGGRLGLAILAEDAEQLLEIGAEASILSARLRRRGAPAGPDLSFELFRHRAGAYLPTEIRLETRTGRVEVAWAGDLAVNGPPAPELFSLEPPPGVPVREAGPGEEVPALDLPLRPVE